MAGNGERHPLLLQRGSATVVSHERLVAGSACVLQVRTEQSQLNSSSQSAVSEYFKLTASPPVRTFFPLGFS